MPRKKSEPKAATKAKTTKTVKKTASRTTAKATPKAAAKTSPKSAAKAGAKATPSRTVTKSSARSAKKSTKVAPAETKAAVVESSIVEAPVSDKAAAATTAAASNGNLGKPLTGIALVEKVKELGNLSKEDKAKACGYYATTKNGMERVNMMKFLNALIDAEGIDLDGKSGDSNGRGGRSASYRITVQSNGNLLIGAAYTKQMDLKPGDEFKITLGRKHIRLTQVDGGSDEE